MFSIHPVRRLLPLFLMVLFAAPCFAQSMFNDIYVRSAGAGGGDLIVRLYRPGSGATRYGAEGAVVVVVPGGADSGNLDDDKAVSTILREGLVVVKFLFPGGSWVDPVSGTVLSSAGTYDARGRNCIRALRDVVRYCLGHYGKPVGPIAPEVLDRVDSLTGGAEPIEERPGALVEPWIERLRKERGPFRNDDDLLLAAFYQPPVLEPLFAERERPGRRTDFPLSALTPMDQLLDQIDRRPKSTHITVQKGDTVIERDASVAAE